MFCRLKQRERICFRSTSAKGTSCRDVHGGDGAVSPCPAPHGTSSGLKTLSFCLSMASSAAAFAATFPPGDKPEPGRRTDHFTWGNAPVPRGPARVQMQSRRMPLAWADINSGLCKYALSSTADSLWVVSGSLDGSAEPGRDRAQAASIPCLCAQPAADSISHPAREQPAAGLAQPGQGAQ